VPILALPRDAPCRGDATSTLTGFEAEKPRANHLDSLAQRGIPFAFAER